MQDNFGPSAKTMQAIYDWKDDDAQHVSFFDTFSKYLT